MTQHYHTTKSLDNKYVSVLAGWDRMLQCFFLVVEELSEDGTEIEGENSGFDEDSSYLYSDVDDSKYDGTWEYYESVLTGFGIKIPDAMSTAIIDDSAKNLGNVVTHWDAK